MELLLTVVSFIVAAALSLVTNLVSGFFTRDVEKRKKLTYLAFIALVLLQIFIYILLSSVTQNKAVENIQQLSDKIFRQSNNSTNELTYLSDFTRITELQRCVAVSKGEYIIPDHRQTHGGTVEGSSSALPNLQFGIAGSRTLQKRTNDYNYYSFTKNYCLPSSSQLEYRKQLELIGSLALILTFVEAEGGGVFRKGMTGVTVVSSNGSLFGICRANASSAPPKLGIESITVHQEIQCPSGSTRIDD